MCLCSKESREDMRRIALYNTDNPGKLVKAERVRKGMTQRELAVALGVTAGMVARMELMNHGLDSVTTRRDIAKALGVSPLIFGVTAGGAITKTTSIYTTKILQSSLDLHKRTYYTNGNLDFSTIHGMTSEVGSMLKMIGPSRELLTIYTEYALLTMKVAAESGQKAANHIAIKQAIASAKSLGDPTLTSRVLSTASLTSYDLGDSKQSEIYARESLTYPRIPRRLKAAFLINLALATADYHEMEKARALLTGENDYPGVPMDLGYYYLRHGETLLANGEHVPAMRSLDIAENMISPDFMRRHCLLQMLQAKYYIGRQEYENAHTVSQTAMILAQKIQSKPNIARLHTLSRVAIQKGRLNV